MENQAPLRLPRLDLSDVGKRKGLSKQLRSSLKKLSGSAQGSPRERPSHKTTTFAGSTHVQLEAVDASLSSASPSPSGSGAGSRWAASPAGSGVFSPSARSPAGAAAYSLAPRVKSLPQQGTPQAKQAAPAPSRSDPGNPVRAFLRSLLAVIPTPILVGAAFTTAALGASLAAPRKAELKKPEGRHLFGLKLTWYTWDSLKQWGLLAPLKQ